MLLDLTAVQKRFGKVEALRGLTAAIDGRKVGLLGPNGAGKSTLLKVLLGLTPFEGRAEVLGRDPRTHAAEIRDRVGYMPESDSYLSGMNAVELCAYAGELSGLPHAAALERAHAALYHAGLEDKRYMVVEGYSTGMKQRVKLAQALVHAPELLFLDEPTNGLDPAGRDEMLALIDELPTRTGARVLLSTHLLPDVEQVCDQVIVLQHGALLFAGGIAELTGADDGQRYEVRVKEGAARLAARLTAGGLAVETMAAGETLRVRLVSDDTGVILAAAVELGVQLRHLAPLRATLEDAFLRALAGGALAGGALAGGASDTSAERAP